MNGADHYRVTLFGNIDKNLLISDADTENPTPDQWGKRKSGERIFTLIPTSRPFILNNGPPELPGLMIALI